MNQSIGSLLTAILAIATVPAGAQWLNVPTKGIPRTKDGKPDLSALAPRKSDGKPDLSGVWQSGEEDRKYIRELNVDLKPGDLPLQPWADDLTRYRRTGVGQSEFSFGPLPAPRCNHPRRSSQLSTQDHSGTKLVVILYEHFGMFRQIFLDGRTLPENPNPTWMGYSIGHWDKDVLVVDSAGFNGKVWLDPGGHPSTDALRLTERFRREDFGHLDIQITIDDPKAYTKQWIVTMKRHLLVDTDLLEFVCNENEKDVKHMADK